jgi:uncharacterized membrane protein
MIGGRLRYRWRALLGLAVGLGTWLALRGFGFLPGAAVLYAWNAALIAYLGATLALILSASPDHVRTEAGRADEGRVVIMSTIVAAVLISVAAIIYAVREGKGAHPHIPGEAAGWLTALSLTTLILGWLTIQALFTLHYAHRYFGDRDGDGTADQGIKFPGDDPCTYRDFLYVAVCVGATCQVSDFNITHRRYRDLVTSHAILAFVYNTMVLALGINIFASLMGQ